MAGEGGPSRVDPIDRAHLTGRSMPSPPIHRYGPSPDLTDLVLRYWIPVWSLSTPWRQRTLQYPVFLIVVSPDYARLYGVSRGASEVVLEGDGWAVGVMLTPAAGRLLLSSPGRGQMVSELTDAHVDLEHVTSLDAPDLVEELRAAMSLDPHAESAHLAAIGAYEERLRAFLPVDEEGLLVNRVVAWLEHHPDVSRVPEVAEAFGLTERTLQRLIERWIGMTPKWLLQRRRLHDAIERLKAGGTTVGAIAAELGYTDQAHFTRDFKALTGLTPGEYRADQPGGS